MTSQAVIIPRQLLKGRDLVIIPRTEYEEYLHWRNIIPEVQATRSERRAMSAGRKEIARGEYLNLKQLKHELAG